MHVTPSLLPIDESNTSWILLFAVTVLVFTVTLDEPAAMATKPSINDPHGAGAAVEKHCPSVASVADKIFPAIVPEFITCRLVVFDDG